MEKGKSHNCLTIHVCIVFYNEMCNQECTFQIHEYLHNPCQWANSRQSLCSNILNICEMIGIFIKWRIRIRIVDSVFKRFCVFSVLCVQVPEFAPGDASWHHWCHHIYIHIEYLPNFLHWTSLYQYSEICRICEYIYIRANLLIFCGQSGVAVPELSLHLPGHLHLAQAIWAGLFQPSWRSLSTHDHHHHGHHDPESSSSSRRSGWSISRGCRNFSSQLWTGPELRPLPHSGRNQPWQYFMSHFHPAPQVWNEQLGETFALSHGHSTGTQFCLKAFNTGIFNQLAQIWQNINHSWGIQANLLSYCQNPRFLSSKKLSSKSFLEGILCIFTFATKHVSFSFRSSLFPFQSPFLEPLCKYVGQGGGERRNYEVKFSLHWVHTGSQLHVWEISQKSLKVEGLISKDFQQARKTR